MRLTRKWQRRHAALRRGSSDEELIDAAAIPLVRAALHERGLRRSKLLRATVAAHKLVKAGMTIDDAVTEVSRTTCEHHH